MASTDDYTPPSYSTDSAGEFAGDPLIEKLHGYYHLGSDDYDTSSSYGMSVAGFFFSVIIIGVFCMLVLWLFRLCACCSCCRKCPCCSPCFGVFEGHPIKGKAVVIGMFFFSALVATCSYAGRNIFQDAVTKSSKDLRSIASSFDAFEAYSLTMVGQSETYYSATVQVACTGGGAADANQGLFDVQRAMASACATLEKLTAGLGDDTRKAADRVEDDVPPLIDLGLGLLTAIVWINWLLGSLAAVTSCSCDDCLVLVLGSVTMLLLIVVAATEHTFAVTMADFCYPGPENSLIETVPGDLIAYFLTCIGTSPMAPQFSTARSQVAEYATMVTDIENDAALTCNAAGLDTILTTNAAMTATIDSFETAAGCPEINPTLLAVLHKMLCGDFVRGLFVCTMVHTAAGFGLWFTFMVSPCALNTKPLVAHPREVMKRISTSDLKGRLASGKNKVHAAEGLEDDPDFFKDDAPDERERKAPVVNPEDPWDLPGTDDDPPEDPEPVAIDADGKIIEDGE